MNMQIHHDGEYPFDQVWICSKDHKHSVWKRVTNISEGKAKALLGMKEDQYLLNKGYVVYHSGPDYALAVYSHDSSYIIMRTEVESVVRQFEDRHVGDPIEGLNTGGTLGMTMAYMTQPGTMEVGTSFRTCPN